MKRYEKQCEALCAKIVKLEAGMRCEFCGRTDAPLASHHAHRHRRQVWWTKYIPDFSISLCEPLDEKGCHRYAHANPSKFMKKFARINPDKAKAIQTKNAPMTFGIKPDYKKIYHYLQARLDIAQRDHELSEGIEPLPGMNGIGGKPTVISQER